MLPDKMRAAAIDRFGGPEVIHTEVLPVPELSPHEVLIEVRFAGVGSWDPELLDGSLGDGSKGFPRVFGSDGSGVVVACGEKVTRFQPDDRVYGWGFENRKGGFFAEYAAIPEDKLAKVPSGLSLQAASCVGVDGIVALEGLDELKCESGQTIVIIGASGGAGHLACQLALRRGLRVYAIASGADGVDLAKRLGCQGAVDGKLEHIGKLADEFSPEGYDGALVLAGAPHRWESVLALLKRHSRVVYPYGVEPEPKAPSRVKVKAFNGVSTPKMYEELNGLIESDGPPFHVEVAHVYPLDQAAQAMREVGQHHLGKLALRVRD
jgi:NADPH:quinone reductase-like Zn-dependent oxidoreductase